MSYGLYLWHSPVYRACEENLRFLGPPALTVTQIALSFGAAAASYYLLERHALALKRRIPRARSAPGIGADVATSAKVVRGPILPDALERRLPGRSEGDAPRD